MLSEFHLVVEQLFGSFPPELEGKLKKAFVRIPRAERDDFLAALALELVQDRNHINSGTSSKLPGNRLLRKRPIPDLKAGFNSESQEAGNPGESGTTIRSDVLSDVIFAAVERVKRRIFRELERQRRHKLLLLERQQRHHATE